MASKKKVTIFGASYEPPTASSNELTEIEERVQRRSKAVRTGQRQRLGLRGLLTGQRGRLSPAERYAELMHLVQDYESLIEHLKESQGAYEQFFNRLARGVREGVAEKCARAREMEERRLELARRGIQKDNQGLVEQAKLNERRLMESVRMLAHATVLMLKKIELSRQSVITLARDQARQQQVLESLVGDLRDHREMFELDQEIGRFEQEVAEAAKMALNFEAYLRDHFGPLQTLLHQVSRVDTELLRALREIQTISETLNPEYTGPLPSLGDEEQILDMVLSNAVNSTKLAETLSRSEMLSESIDMVQPCVDMGGDATVKQALDNIQILVRARLTNQPGLLEAAAALPSERAAAKSDRAAGDNLAQPRELEARVAAVKPRPVRPAPIQKPLSISADTAATFAEVPADTFTIGSPLHEVGRRPDETQCRVTLSRAFSLQTTPVTQAQFEALMHYNPSRFKGASRPVETVSWFEAIAYCNALSRQQGLPEAYELSHLKLGKDQTLAGAVVAWERPGAPGFRLPTEAEWEYAVRAGTLGATYASPDDPEGEAATPAQLKAALEQIAWFGKNSSARTHPVERMEPNGWGLHDMVGNVWEWVWDRYGPYPDEPRTDLVGGSEATQRVMRGGSWLCATELCRSATRGKWAPDKGNHNTGFRVCRTAT